MMIKLITCLTAKISRIGILAVLLFCVANVASAKTFTFAIVPQLPKEITHKNWGPFIYEINKRSHINFKLLLFNSFQEFEKSFSSGEPDFVYLNPYHQLLANKAQGYIPLVRDNSNMLTGILVVKKDSPVTGVEQLKGKKIAFPSPLAFGASLYMRAALLHQGINVQPVYVKSHNNVYRSVLLGTALAGGGVNSTLKSESKQIQQQLKIIYKLPGVPSHPISAHPRVDKKTREDFIATIMDMMNSSQGRQLLKAVNIPSPVSADQARDYRPLEALNLDRILEDNQITKSIHRNTKHGG